MFNYELSSKAEKYVVQKDSILLILKETGFLTSLPMTSFLVILAYARINLGKASELAHDTFGQAQMLH